MKALTSKIKKTGKTDRERKVLIGLVEHYIQTGKPVGSNALKDVGFEDLSSATIRNYFANLENEGYLTQQHSSGGRIPTGQAFRLYANEYCQESINLKKKLKLTLNHETRAIASLLQQSAEELASHTRTAVFLSAPRFEQDFIIDIKLVVIDTGRCLCVLITDFGEIKTEMLYTDQKLSLIGAKRLENYFNWRLKGQNKPDLDPSEEELGQKIYNELLVRYVVGYSQFNEEEIYRTGLSSLLNYPELQDPTVLANSLTLFENTHGIRLLLKECSKFDMLKFWIGHDLVNFSPQAHPDCAVIAIPYHVNNKPIGSIGLFGPLRMPYRSHFNYLKQFSEEVSRTLTNALYKFKISLKEPTAKPIETKSKNPLLIHVGTPLLEDNRVQKQKNPERRIR